MTRKTDLTPARTAEPGSLDRNVSDDHAHVQRLFDDLDAGVGDRLTLGQQVGFHVAAHAAGEEQVFYPEISKDVAQQARDDHSEVKRNLVVMDEHQPGEPEWEQALLAVMTEIREHAEKEENDWLPGLRSSLGAEKMLELGDKFLAAKRKAPSHAHPHAPDTKIAEKVAGLPTALVDKVRDRRSGAKDRIATDASGRLEAEAQVVIDAFSGLHPLPVEILTPKEARLMPTAADAVKAVLEARGEKTDPEPVSLVQDRTIPGPDGELNIRLYVPETGESAQTSSAPGLPGVLYIHGGGWVIADIDVYDASARAVANASGAIVLSVEYRHAPEHPFPAAHDDVLAAFRWLRANAADIGVDPARIAIVGESAGATMAAATVVSLQRAGDAAPSAAVLIYPVTSASMDWDSYAENADAVPLNTAMLGWFVHHTVSGETKADWRLDLLSLPDSDLAAFPPSLVVVAERDPLRDQAHALADRLAAAGAPVAEKIYLGVPHEFFGMSAVLDAARDAVSTAGATLRQAFGTSLPERTEILTR